MCVSEDTCRRQVWRRHARRCEDVGVRRHFPKTVGRRHARTHGRAKTLPEDMTSRQLSIWSVFCWNCTGTDSMAGNATNVFLVPDGTASVRVTAFDRCVRTHDLRPKPSPGSRARTRSETHHVHIDMASGMCGVARSRGARKLRGVRAWHHLPMWCCIAGRGVRMWHHAVSTYVVSLHVASASQNVFSDVRRHVCAHWQLL